MTTTQPTTIAELQVPAWLNVGALITDDDLAAIAEVQRLATRALEVAIETRAAFQAVYDRWNEICRATGGGDDPFQFLSEVSGYEHLQETLCLAGIELLDAWDPFSTPDEVYVKKLRAAWAAEYPGLDHD